MKYRFTYIFIITVISVFMFAGWGKTGHQKINFFTTTFFPSEMSAFTVWNYSLFNHASDADNRKSSDPTEDIKHYIDIDTYTAFILTGKISQDFASANQGEGILPWATISAVDSLTANFKRKDWNKAILTASDLGHYVGDGHNPLHITKNFNKNGVHSPYESTMIDKYSSQITFNKDSVSYISNVPDYVFNYIYENYKFCDSIFIADNYAYNLTNKQRNTAYYDTLWTKTKGLTVLLVNKAAKRLAALMYTAWTNAGKPQLTTSVIEDLNGVLKGYEVYQNYPNPFNPETKIKFSVPAVTKVTLKIYDSAGRELKTLLNEEKSAGLHEYSFNAEGLPSGVYYYNVTFGSYSSVKKMVLMK